MKARNSMKNYIVFAVIVVLIGLVGHMDQKDEIIELRIYCENVRDGVWPDYNNIYELECKKPQ